MRKIILILCFLPVLVLTQCTTKSFSSYDGRGDGTATEYINDTTFYVERTFNFSNGNKEVQHIIVVFDKKYTVFDMQLLFDDYTNYNIGSFKDFLKMVEHMTFIKWFLTKEEAMNFKYEKEW